MGYVVTREDGNEKNGFRILKHEESELIVYARLLSQRGVKLGHALRAPEPGSRRRWLYVWDNEARAQEFANDLNRRSKEAIWKVVEVNGESDEGPLGPILLYLSRRDGVSLSLDSLSEPMIRAVCPDAYCVSSVEIARQRWEEFIASRRPFADLVARTVPLLTGLSREPLEALGYAVVDVKTGETLLFAAPADTAGTRRPVGDHCAVGWEVAG